MYGTPLGLNQTLSIAKDQFIVLLPVSIWYLFVLLLFLLLSLQVSLL